MLLTGLCQFYHNIHYGRWYGRSDVIAEDEMIWMYCFGGATRIGTHRAATPGGAALRAVPAQSRISFGFWQRIISGDEVVLENVTLLSRSRYLAHA